MGVPISNHHACRPQKLGHVRTRLTFNIANRSLKFLLAASVVVLLSAMNKACAEDWPSSPICDHRPVQRGQRGRYRSAHCVRANEEPTQPADNYRKYAGRKRHDWGRYRCPSTAGWIHATRYLVGVHNSAGNFCQPTLRCGQGFCRHHFAWQLAQRARHCALQGHPYIAAIGGLRKGQPHNFRLDRGRRSGVSHNGAVPPSRQFQGEALFRSGERRKH